MYKIGSLPHSIPIGYTGETNFRTIEIDMTAWMEKMPAGVPSIVHIRPGESKADAYVAVTEFDTETNVLTWNITAADIGTLEGEGEMQIWLEEPDEEDTDVISKRGKSVKVTTKVTDAANDPSSTVPSSQEAFLEQVTSLKTQTVSAKEAAEDAQDAAETAQAAAEQAAEDAENVNLHPAYIDSTTKHWMVYDATQHEYVDTQIKAQGEDGQDGQDGQDATPTLVCPAYADLTFPVTKDTLCYKDGTLYKAKQDISTSEAWTAAHWDATNIAEQQRLLKTAIQGIDEKIFEDKNFLDSSAWLSKTNNAVSNNGDGTYTIGTGDYGSVFWESIGDVPAGKYKIPGSTFGFVTVATTKSYTENVIIKNETGEDVEFTNPTKQHLFLCQRTTTHPSRSFTFAPFISQKTVKVQEEIEDLNNAKLIEKTDNIVTAIGKKTTKTGNCVTMQSVVGQIVVNTTTADGTAYISGDNLIDINGKGIDGSGSDTLATIVNRWITDRKYTMGVYIDDSADHTDANSLYVTAVAPIVPGVTYYMSVTDTFSRYYILDDEMNIVGGSSTSWFKNNSFVAPDGSRYLVTSYKKDSAFVHCGIRKESGKFTEIVTATDGVPATPKYDDIVVFAKNGETISVTAFVYDENAVEKQKKLDSARFVHGGSVTPLTILHISDIHGDSDTIARIIEKASAFTGIDEMICTGDMVADTYEQITSWWPVNMLTCIGNHDTASYSSGTGYNWTALSMANRDAYYIAPFESSWGITHTSGKSYYYKDYATQKVRMIVMDGMLYTDNGADATAQTAWMEDLLDDAIENNLHVLIAIHAPHGGATSVDCSFSKIGNSTMPLWNDCNTPQAVIDAVATKITGGLKFIGYLCGHAHQDWLWDAEGDGKQLMYCIACASNNYPQWKNTDIYHSKQSDIFNLVTIDTEHTMVKLIRGGGGDFTNRMKMRKAICFDYSTGEVVGEVL